MQSMPQTSTPAGVGTCAILGRLLRTLGVLGVAGLIAALLLPKLHSYVRDRDVPAGRTASY